MTKPQSGDQIKAWGGSPRPWSITNITSPGGATESATTDDNTMIDEVKQCTHDTRWGQHDVWSSTTIRSPLRATPLTILEPQKSGFTQI